MNNEWDANMADNGQSIDFSSVLAAAVHDMKGSLNLLIQSLEHLNTTLAPENQQARAFLSTAHYESARLNTDLVQLLSLYRAEIENLPITIDECYIDDLLEDISLTHESYLKLNNISLEVIQEDNLTCYLDQGLILLVLTDILVNAMKYGKKKLRLSAFKEEQWLLIRIEDNGPGYPDRMLETNDLPMQDFNIREGRTGLGLFFAKLIANAHSSGNRKGSIFLSNGGELGGSVFTLRLPLDYSAN